MKPMLGKSFECVFVTDLGYLIGTQLISRVRGQRLSLRDFYLKRALRILPAFLTVLALYILAEYSRY